jgi:hypothetical protein
MCRRMLCVSYVGLSPAQDVALEDGEASFY